MLCDTGAPTRTTGLCFQHDQSGLPHSTSFSAGWFKVREERIGTMKGGVLRRGSNYCEIGNLKRGGGEEQKLL